MTLLGVTSLALASASLLGEDENALEAIGFTAARGVNDWFGEMREEVDPVERGVRGETTVGVERSRGTEMGETGTDFFGETYARFITDQRIPRDIIVSMSSSYLNRSCRFSSCSPFS